MVTTKRCAFGTCKNDSWYPESWKRNPNGDPVKFFHFPGAVRQNARRQKWILVSMSPHICSLHFVGVKWGWQAYTTPTVRGISGIWTFTVFLTKYDICCERVAYLHSILWRRAQLWLELFESTVGRFLSRVSYLPFYVFLRRRRSTTSRKLHACLEKPLYFSCTIWSSLCFWSLMIPRLIVFVPQDSNVTLYVQVCWLCCVLYIPLFGLVRSSMRHQLAVFLKYSVRLKLLAQLVIDRCSGKSK